MRMPGKCCKKTQQHLWRLFDLLLYRRIWKTTNRCTSQLPFLRNNKNNNSTNGYLTSRHTDLLSYQRNKKTTGQCKPHLPSLKNNNNDNNGSLTSCRTDGGKKLPADVRLIYFPLKTPTTTPMALWSLFITKELKKTISQCMPDLPSWELTTTATKITIPTMALWPLSVATE